MKFLTALFTVLVFTTSIFASNIDNSGDNETTTSIEATSQKKSGQVVYNCGDTPCEGFKQAFHTNGKLQISGTFKNGIAVDTLKEFDAAGQMMRLFLPNTDNGFEMQFYPDGQIKRVYENNTNQCTYYYNNGNVWLTYKHDAGTRTNLTQYYENGQVRLVQKGNKQVVYYGDGKIAYEFKRKVTSKKGGVALYAYTYEAFNQVYVKVTTATFTATSMDFKNGFPLEFSDVADKDFGQINYFDEVGNPLK
ncbi:MAG: hypothetical protein AB8G11_10990, partial [Saprospiraceae bacterium]